jgi:hypothetical protein
MNTNTHTPAEPAPTDQDMVDQARPGFGIPSQDPRPEAQSPLEPGEAEREAHSVLAGGGAIVGVAAGAAIGVAVAGPVGAVVGGTLGAVAGALGGAAAGSAANPPDATPAVPTVPAPPVRPAPAR